MTYSQTKMSKWTLSGISLACCLFVFQTLILLSPNLALAQSTPTPEKDSCTKQCVIHADCGVGGYCDAGTCRYKSKYCSNERWSTNERGETSNCDAYKCVDDLGTCPRSATKIDDCTLGFVFDGKTSCVPSVNCDINNSEDAACKDLWDRWQVTRSNYEKTTPEANPPLLTCQACQGHDQCSNSQMCWQGRCVTNDYFCSIDAQGGHQVSSKNGVEAFCGNYTCEKVTHTCLTQCLKPQDCRDGKTCTAGVCL